MSPGPSGSAGAARFIEFAAAVGTRACLGKQTSAPVSAPGRQVCSHHRLGDLSERRPEEIGHR